MPRSTWQPMHITVNEPVPSTGLARHCTLLLPPQELDDDDDDADFL